jgi:hypothetical protein
MTDVDVANAETKPSRFPEVLNPWLTAVLSGSAVLGLLWVIVQFWNPLRPVDVTVVSQDALEFSLPAGASVIQKLALTYDGRPIGKVSLIPVTVVNSGNQPIQAQKDSSSKEWILALRSTNKIPIERVGELTREPRYVQAETEPGPTADVLHLRVTLLNPGESVSMQLGLIGGGNKFSILAEEIGPRIPNLRLATTTGSVRNRIQNAFLPPLWVVSVIALLVLASIDVRRGRIPIGPLSWHFVREGTAAMCLFTFASILFAGAVSWLISWIVYWVAFR